MGAMTDHPMIAVRITVEYQLATKAAKYQSTLTFGEGTSPATVVEKVSTEAGRGAQAAITEVAVALGMSRAGT